MDHRPRQLGFDSISPMTWRAAIRPPMPESSRPYWQGGPVGAQAAVLLNAAAAIYVSGMVSTLSEAVVKAREALDSGAGRRRWSDSEGVRE
jgi:anthranilate phosphoribosyltransferase